MDVTMLKTHLGDELYAQVEERLGGLDGFQIIATNDGSWLPKNRLDAEITKRKDLQTTINSLTGELNDAKQKLAASESLQAQIEKLTGDLTERDGQITALKRSGKIREALSKANFRDVSIGERVLDMSKIGEDKDGKLTGLEEQIKALHENSPFLFADSGQKGGFGYEKSTVSSGTDDSHYDVNSAIRAAAGRHAL